MYNIKYLDYIIKIFHVIFIYLLMISPFINNCVYKLNSLILFIFIVFHYMSKYGKCGIINIERAFLKEHFREGFFFKLIKPVISYKNNIFYYNLFYMLIIYCIILSIQINDSNCISNIINDIKYNIYLLRQ